MLPVSMLSSNVPGPREGESAAARHPPYAPLLDPAGQGSGASAAAPGPRPALQPAGRGSGASARRALAALACTRAAAGSSLHAAAWSPFVRRRRMPWTERTPSREPLRTRCAPARLVRAARLRPARLARRRVLLALRSISLPTRSYALVLKAEQELQWLRALVSPSSALPSAHALCALLQVPSELPSRADAAEWRRTLRC